MPIGRFVSFTVLCFAMVSILPADPVARVGDVAVSAKDLARVIANRYASVWWIERLAGD